MSGFKDCVNKDRRNVFLNLNFFAETVRVEGVEIPVVIDNDELKKRQGGQELAIAESATLFYAMVEDLPTRRANGESLNVNGRVCTIDDWKEENGIAIIVLQEPITA